MLVVVSLAGCRKEPPPQRSRPFLPVVKSADIPPPPETQVVLKAGMNLHMVAESTYGHERFSGVIAVHNQIRDETRIPANTSLETPSLPVLFQRDGLDPQYQPAINALAWAIHEFYQRLPELDKIRSGTPTEGTVSLPSEMQASLQRLADAIDAANGVLAHVQPPHHPPKKAIGQLDQAVAQMGLLATGLKSMYDTELAGQRLGLGTTNLLVWVRNHHQ